MAPADFVDTSQEHSYVAGTVLPAHNCAGGRKRMERLWKVYNLAKDIMSSKKKRLGYPLQFNRHMGHVWLL